MLIGQKVFINLSYFKTKKERLGKLLWCKRGKTLGGFFVLFCFLNNN